MRMSLGTWASAVHHRSQVIRRALVAHWHLTSRLCAHAPSLTESIAAAGLVNFYLEDADDLRELAQAANWAKHAPPPGLSALKPAPKAALRAELLEAFRRDVLPGAGHSTTDWKDSANLLLYKEDAPVTIGGTPNRQDDIMVADPAEVMEFLLDTGFSFADWKEDEEGSGHSSEEEVQGTIASASEVQDDIVAIQPAKRVTFAEEAVVIHFVADSAITSADDPLGVCDHGSSYAADDEDVPLDAGLSIAVWKEDEGGSGHSSKEEAQVAIASASEVQDGIAAVQPAKRMISAEEAVVIHSEADSAVVCADDDPGAPFSRTFGGDIVGGCLQIREPSGAWTTHLVQSFAPNEGHTLLRDDPDSDEDTMVVLDISALYAQGCARFCAFADSYGREFPDGWEQQDLRPFSC